MDELLEIRQNIDEIDRQIAKLFEERMACSAAVAEIKRRTGLPVKDTAREKELTEKNVAHIKDKALKAYYGEFMEKTLELSCRYQETLLKK